MKGEAEREGSGGNQEWRFGERTGLQGRQDPVDARRARRGQGCGERRGCRAEGSPRSAALSMFWGLSPAPPPSGRTGSGLSGTARTLRGETPAGERLARPAGSAVPPSPSGRPPYLAAPASDSWRPCLAPVTGSVPDSTAPGLRVYGAGNRGYSSASDGSDSLCTRVSRATDRNRNAAVSRQPQSPA